MRTPKEYTQMIKKGYVTEAVVGEVLYSINKRAKNWRDKEREYKGYIYDTHNLWEKAMETKKYYYKMKDDILAKFNTTTIHYLEPNNWSPYYSGYFKYYEIGEYSFHTPIPPKSYDTLDKELKEEGYEIIKLDELVTKGKDIIELLSTHFCKKVYEGLINNTLIIQL